MVNLGEIILGAAISTSVSQSMAKSDDSDREPAPDDGGDMKERRDRERSLETHESMEEKLQRLIDLEERNKPTTSSVDSYASEVVTVPDGGTATVTVTPTKGFNLRVKKVYFDRRTDHTYTHRIDGTELSSNHQLTLSSTRLVRHGGKIVSVVENNSGTAETLDFELEAWAIPEV